MRVAILGTGGIGRGYAAFLASTGHTPVLWSPTGTGLIAPGGALVATGVVAGSFHVRVAAGCAEAVRDADAVLLAVTGNGLYPTIEAVAPVLRNGQPVIISGHLAFAALHLSRRLAAHGVRAPIAAWATTAVTARRGAGFSVHVSGRRAMLDVATLPVADAATGLRVCQDLFGDRFRAQSDLLAIMLSNLNPPAHMANMLCNLTRAERGEDWANYGGITPAVARLIRALDAERLALAAAFGLQVRTIEDHFVASFGVERASLADMAQVVFGKRPDLKGPKTLDTRFVTEDVPFGLVPLVLLGQVAGVPMPLHDAGVALFSALYDRRFEAENDLLPTLQLDRLSRAQVHDALRNG